MSFKKKLVHELVEIFWITLYFMAWFGALIVLKTLLLEEYKIAFSGFSIILVASLIGAKVVLILQNMPIGPKSAKIPAWFEILLRTLLYLMGVFVIMVLEQGIEARHEYGGVTNAVAVLFEKANFYHILTNTICVFGALLGLNLWSVLQVYLGEGGFQKILISPIPEEKK